MKTIVFLLLFAAPSLAFSRTDMGSPDRQISPGQVNFQAFDGTYIGVGDCQGEKIRLEARQTESSVFVAFNFNDRGYEQYRSINGPVYSYGGACWGGAPLRYAKAVGNGNKLQVDVKYYSECCMSLNPLCLDRVAVRVVQTLVVNEDILSIRASVRGNGKAVLRSSFQCRYKRLR